MIKVKLIYNIAMFMLYLSAGIYTMRKKQVPKLDFVCCWILLLEKTFMVITNLLEKMI